MRKEPVITVASLTALVAATLGLLVSFGIDVSKDQQNAILAVVAVVAPLAVAAFARSKVTPNEYVSFPDETPDDPDVADTH